MSNGLEKYISFSLDNTLLFIASFQFFYSLLNSLVKNLVENDSNHLSQGSDSEVLYLFKQRNIIPMNICDIFTIFKKIDSQKRVL